MAFLNKLLSSSNKRKTCNTGRQCHYLSQFPFHTNQVRILLYRECDNRGRRLLFDSSALEKTNLGQGSGSCNTSQKIHTMYTKESDSHDLKDSCIFTRTSDGFFYKLGRPTTDITAIGEVVFGALAMSFRGTSLKVHWLKSPTRILCSQVFLSPIHSNGFLKNQLNRNSPLRSNQTDHSAAYNTSINSFSMPFPVCINKDLIELKSEMPTNILYVPNLQEASERTESISIGDSGCHDLDLWSDSNSSCYQYIVGSSLTSVFTYPGSTRKLSVDSSFDDNSSINSSKSSSDSSLRRRISRNISTSFENRTSTSDFICFIDDNYQISGRSDRCVAQHERQNDFDEYRSNLKSKKSYISNNEASSSGKYNRQVTKRAKLGLALCITMTESCETEMERFCSEHIALLESMLCRLRAFVENAYINHELFLQIMLNAWEFIARWIKDLFTTPRLPCPIWLSISTNENKNSKSLADSFVKELCCLLSFADTKSTNFFISKILTAILTNHLGWVSTVAALKSKPKSQVIEIVNEIKIKLFQVSQKHPYNALWAQMGDLYGAIGNPPKISRTIIYGTKKHMVEKLLHILTYFIRCGEIRRMSESEVFSKESLSKLLSGGEKYSDIINEKAKTVKSELKRNQTCMKNLDSINFTDDMQNKCSGLFIDIKNNNKDDISNVLAFRQSDFYQQELEEMEGISDHTNKVEKSIITTDINVLAVRSSNNTVIPSKCLDIENVYISDSELAKGIIESKEKDIEPVQDNLNLENLYRAHKGIDTINEDKKESKNITNSECASTVSNLTENTQFNHLGQNIPLNRPHLIVANNFVKDEHVSWSLEPIKVVASMQGKQHFEFDETILQKKENQLEKNDVVFVLGENDTLINIRKSTEDISSSEKIIRQTNKRRICNYHKKHSGVKFNFKQYPQIATNYMRNKNLDISNYNFFKESSKLDDISSFGPSTSTFPMLLPKVEENTSEECEYCTGNGVTTLETPSNATELEFESDENYLISSAIKIIEQENNLKISSTTFLTKVENTVEEKHILNKDEFTNSQKLQYHVGGKSVNIDFIYIPIPGTNSNSQFSCKSEFKSGFIPSLLLGINDYYIPDMVLQGTNSSPQLWEKKLQQDLTVSSHCALLNSIPTENVAIIADMEKWEVKVLSSKTTAFPYTSNVNGPVGMSQLVSTMLETVCAMNSCGVSSYECLLYIESKLQEIYLQSEALAAFLFATEFCSLNTVTSALNVSSNDVPLLLSVASVHSPQLTKTYGVSFR